MYVGPVLALPEVSYCFYQTVTKYDDMLAIDCFINMFIKHPYERDF